MSTGIRAEIKIKGPHDCPIAQVSDGQDSCCTNVSRSSTHTDDGQIIEEFLVPKEVEVNSDDIEKVFSYESKDMYRFNREEGIGCACECVEEHHSPVVDVYSDERHLHLTFHVKNVDQLKKIMQELKSNYSEVKIKRFLREKEKKDDEDRMILIDSSRLTDRQREVLRKAHKLGYFDHPKKSNAGEVAKKLGITTSTFTEHLAAAQKKLMGAVIDG
ncbi:MAG: helix-turn-helix domain-containing protein [Halobacteria archaeon]